MSETRQYKLLSVYLTGQNKFMLSTKRCNSNSVKRSDVTGNRFEWELGEN